MTVSTYAEVPLPEHMSYSQLKTLSACGEKYLLEKGYGLRGEPWWAGIGGSAVHVMTELWDREYAFSKEDEFDLYGQWGEIFEKATAAEEERSGHLRDTFQSSGRKSKAWPDKEGESFWNEMGPIYVNYWMQWRHMSPWDVVEYGGELAIEAGVTPTFGGVPVVGSIDRVMVAPNGDLLVVDLKTGGRPEPGYLQLATYSAGLRRAWSLPEGQAIYGCFWYPRKWPEPLSVPVDLAPIEPVLDQTFARAEAIRKQGLFLPVVADHCGWCKVKQYCTAFGGKHPSELPKNRYTPSDLDEGEDNG